MIINLVSQLDLDRCEKWSYFFKQPTKHKQFTIKMKPFSG